MWTSPPTGAWPAADRRGEHRLAARDSPISYKVGHAFQTLRLLPPDRSHPRHGRAARGALLGCRPGHRLGRQLRQQDGPDHPVPADEGGDVRVVTTETVPGMECGTVDAPVAQFPIMMLPTSGIIGGRTLADGAIRGMKTLRAAAAAAGANEVLGLRTEAYQTMNGNPRAFLYGTLATCR